MSSQNITCLVCGSVHFSPIYHDTLLKCDSCEFITANTRVDYQTLKEIYTVKYFEGEEYLNYLGDKEALQKNFRHRLKRILDNRSDQTFTNVLEIGCAYGFFGEVLKSLIPSVKYTGIDIVPDAVAHGRDVLGLDIIEGSYLELPEPKTAYSEVFMWDVIEHLAQPDLFIDKIARELSPHGCLYLTTGDIGALLPRIRGSGWRMIHPPSHLQYFSKKTMVKFLKRFGFQVSRIWYPPTYRSFAQIYYSLFMLNKNPGSFTKSLFKQIPKEKYIPINTYDIMLIEAVKQ